MNGSQAVILSGASTVTLPALIHRAGKPAALRFLEFFTVNIRNANTRAAYGRAARAFVAWCEDHDITEGHCHTEQM